MKGLKLPAGGQSTEYDQTHMTNFYSVDKRTLDENSTKDLFYYPFNTIRVVGGYTSPRKELPMIKKMVTNNQSKNDKKRIVTSSLGNQPIETTGERWRTPNI